MSENSGSGGPRKPSRRKSKAPDRAALVSHEIRGPLGVMMTLSEVLLARDMAPADRRVLELMRLAGNHALAVAEDLVTEASLAADRLRIVPVAFSPADLVRTMAALWEPVAENGDRVIAIDVDEAPPEMVADEGRVRQVLFNLISNATKFAPRGRILLSARQEGGRVAFEVADEGAGLPEGFRIAPFVSGGDQPGPGTGIGLWISHRLAEALSARLELRPRPEGGTIARLTLPLSASDAPAETATSVRTTESRVAKTGRKPKTSARSSTMAGMPRSERPLDLILVDDIMAVEPAPAAAEKTRSATPLSGLRVLAVDDSSVSRMLMTAVLSSFDMVVTTASSATEAEPLALTCDPDLILLDWSLNGESGADVLAKLHEALGMPLPPVVVVSALDRLPAGIEIAGQIRKPFTPRELYNTIADALVQAGAIETGR